MFKKFFLVIFLVLLLNNSLLLNNTYASFKTQIIEKNDLELNWEIIFKYIAEKLLKEIPESYKYIKLNFKNLDEKNKNYENIQKLVYINVIPNKNVILNLKSKLNAYYFFQIVNYTTWFDFITEKNKEILKSRNVKYSDLVMINEILAQEKKYKENQITKDDYSFFQTDEEKSKFQIYLDVYNTLLSDYYNSDDLVKIDLIYSSINWLTNWTQDQFTTFFPPSESKDFEESLSWEFEWIWAYVDMEKPWILKIISPLSGSPAEKAWLKWWDIITKINDFEITKTTTITEAVSKIKWPALSKVKLTILRDQNTFEVEIIRERIILKDVEYKILDNKFFYIQIRMFWNKVYSEFKNALFELKKSQYKKVIIDLRNNPGWYLEQVTDILSLFIPKWEKTAVVKYKNENYVYYSFWDNKINLWDYEVYILVNSWTASASEIIIATLKDYFPNIKIIWEKTYWKWSVQTVKYYYDGSSFKYTIAKWFSWKTQTWIDKIWISPDVKIVLDVEKFKNGEDNQLNYILQNH